MGDDVIDIVTTVKSVVAKKETAFTRKLRSPGAAQHAASIDPAGLAGRLSFASPSKRTLG